MRIFIFFLLFFSWNWAIAQDLVILHTNDIHSHLMGFSPETEYSPLVNNNDSTLGGFARIAGYIKSERESNNDKLLTVDAGDFLMGTIFQTIELTKGFQLNLMHETGYDYIALGNHEFDYGPDSLAQIINNSKNNGPIPQLLCANFNFDKTPDAEKLKELFVNGTILPFDIFEKNNYRIGIFGIMGEKAANYIPGVYNAEFEKMNKAARKTAKHLKKNEKVDIVIALSHSGIYRDKKGNWKGEDITLGRKNNDIDIIISGHSHSKVKYPIQAGNTIVVQAASSGMYVGRIEVVFDSNGKPLFQYKLVEMNDTIIADKQTQKKIEAQIPIIEQSVLSSIGVNFDTPVLETSFDLTLNEQKAANSNLGPFVADAMYNWLNTENRPGTDIVAVAAGVIRDNIKKGEHGMQNINDIFNVMPLGLGYDSVPGTPLAKIHITGRELKRVTELILAVSDVRTSYYLYFSGMRVYANTDKGLFRKVKSIEIGNEREGFSPISLNKKDTTLYSVTANAYMIGFIGQLKKMSFGLVNVEPKNSEGEVQNPLDMIIDLDPEKKGLQEAKEWLSIYYYARGLDDVNGNGIPDIPQKYRNARNPIIQVHD